MFIIHPIIRQIRPFALWLAAAFAPAAALTGCAELDKVVTPAFMISVEEEAELGKEVDAEIAKQMQLVHDPQLVGYVNQVGARMIAAAPERSPLQTKFFVVNDPSINAFAAPGGSIYVHTGLLEAARDEAELVAVLAHEYGHVVHRHSARGMSRNTGANLVSQLVLGQDAGAVTQMAAGVVGNLALTKYSREDELQADALAVPTLTRGGYDPGALVTFLQTLQAEMNQVVGPAVYFSSHPQTADRIARAQAAASSMPQGQAVRPTNELRRIQGRLRQLGLAKR